MKVGTILSGWYFNIGQTEYFVKSERKNKTKKFAENILKAINKEISEGNVGYILYYLDRANLEVKHCPANPDRLIEPEGFDYYSIYGKNWSGHGTKVDDGKTIILEIA